MRRRIETKRGQNEVRNFVDNDVHFLTQIRHGRLCVHPSILSEILLRVSIFPRAITLTVLNQNQRERGKRKETVLQKELFKLSTFGLL